MRRSRCFNPPSARSLKTYAQSNPQRRRDGRSFPVHGRRSHAGRRHGLCGVGGQRRLAQDRSSANPQHRRWGQVCVNMSLKLGEALGKALVTGDQTEIQRYRDQLSKFTECDPRWAEAAAVYADYFVAQGRAIPYKSVNTIPDPVITDLPSQVRVAIVGDWGTGQPAARTVLSQIKAMQPKIIIHLGDVYYAGTQYEYDNYFTGIWSQVFGVAPDSPVVPHFIISREITTLFRRTSLLQTPPIHRPARKFFILQNDNWQLLSMDTGLHDAGPRFARHSPTVLDPDEAKWVCKKGVEPRAAQDHLFQSPSALQRL